MRGPYSDDAAPPIYIYPDRPKPGIRFSRKELFQLSVAVLALSAAFTVLYIRYDPGGFAADPVLFLAISFPTSLLAVGTGVGLHEVMHKAVAQRYGHWAEFRYDPRGLAMAFVFAVVGFIYGAPGATWISGMVTPEQNGRISAAGPATNLVIGGAFFTALLAFAPTASGVSGAVLLSILSEVAVVNIILAGFNMIPVMPLDGAKVWRWNKAAFAAIVLVDLVLLLVVFFPGLLF